MLFLFFSLERYWPSLSISNEMLDKNCKHKLRAGMWLRHCPSEIRGKLACDEGHGRRRELILKMDGSSFLKNALSFATSLALWEIS